jgi:hypothetical protein
MNFFAQEIEERARKSAGNDEVNVGGLGIQGYDGLSRLEMRQLGAGGNITDHLIRELASPIQTLELDAEPILVKIHGHAP